MTEPDDGPGTREEVIFAEVVDLPAEARAGPLERACGGDQALRARVEALLTAIDKAGDLLESPPPGAAELIAPDVGNGATLYEKPGDCIGGYRLVVEIGSGGCGVVYLAEQQKSVRRQVALKVIKLGMDTRQVVARFEFERQVLAVMSHPNIAHVFEAGVTDSGRPYFVMELVRGIRITQFCDQEKLSTHERLELILQACSAIEHAHQKGVIHRDIKPSNILVGRANGAPALKVIDFGIAKATDGQPLSGNTMCTAASQFVGTPAYMSPEQAGLGGVDVDTRSDIYSLGVLLYEILTGTTPLVSEQLLRLGMEDLCRTVREHEPPTPSRRLTTLGMERLAEVAGRHNAEGPRLLQALRGDLDWIVMKALEKDRTRRYESVGALAEDIRRYLSNQPVLARPPSAPYLFQKLVRRYRLAFTAGAVVATSLILGLAVSTRLYFEEQTARLIAEHAGQRAKEAQRAAETQRDIARRAEAEAVTSRQRADQEAASVKAVSDILRYDILMNSRTNPVVVAPGATGTNPLLRSSLEHDGSRLENRFAGQPLTEAAIRLALGRTLLDLNEGGMGIDHLERAYALRNEILGAEDAGTVEAMMLLADACGRLRRFDRALELRKLLVAVQKSRLGFDAAGTHEALLHLAALHGEMGAHAESLKSLERVLESQKAQHADNAKIAQTLLSIGLARRGLGDADGALASFEKALEMALASCGTKHSLTVELQRTVGRARCARGTWDKGLQLLEQALATEVEGREPGSPEVQMFKNEVAFASESAGRKERALELYQEIHDRLQARHGNNHWAVGKARVDMMRVRHGPSHAETLKAMFDLGRYYAGLRQHEEAVSSYEKALAIMRATRERDDLSMLIEMFNLAGLYQEAVRNEQALVLYREIISRGSGSARIKPTFLAGALLKMEAIHHKLGQPDAAETARERAVQLVWSQVGTVKSLTYQIANTLSPDFLGLGLHEEARALYVKAFENTRAELGAAHPDTYWALRALADAYERAGWQVALEKFLLKTLAELEAEGSAPYLSVTCMEGLEKAYLLQGKADQAADWRSKRIALKTSLDARKAGRN
jgi:serine/threonine protein kinase/tetratricopeptide (TPR) repeat protein